MYKTFWKFLKQDRTLVWLKLRPKKYVFWEKLDKLGQEGMVLPGVERTKTQLAKTLKMPTNENTPKSQVGKSKGKHCPLDLRGRQGEYLGNTSSPATRTQIWCSITFTKLSTLNYLVFPQHISIQIQGFFPWPTSPLVWCIVVCLHLLDAPFFCGYLWDQGVKTLVFSPVSKTGL